MTQGAFDEIPIIDISEAFGSTGPSPDFAEAFTEVSHRVGFALVTNHGVSAELTDSVFDLMARFFALDTETKMLIDKRHSAQFRGWEPVGAETTDNAPDMREQIDVWTEWPVVNDPADPCDRLLGPNQWLDDSILPGHRSISEQWIAALANVADHLMAALSMGLGLDQNHLRALFGEKPMSLAKFIHYPPTPPSSAGVNAHHDAGFLTVLAPGPVAGLQVQNPEGDWIDVPVVPDALVINLGEMFQSMTGNYLVATPHRVITAEERYSAGYFHGPSLDTPLSLLPLDPSFAAAVDASRYHRSAGLMPTPDQASAGLGAMGSTTKPSTYGEQLWNYFGRSYAAQMAHHHGSAPSRPDLLEG